MSSSRGAAEGRPWLDAELDAVLDAVRPALTPHQRVDPDRPADPGPEVVGATDRLVEAVARLRIAPQRQIALVGELQQVLAPALPLLHQRAEQARQSGAREDEADARALVARAQLALAWQVRGGGWATTVTRSQWDTFLTLVDRADDQCRQAMALVPHHPLAATERLRTALGSADVDEPGWHRRFQDATTLVPTSFAAHQRMLLALTPKWYGSLGAMFAFARQVAALAPAGDPVVAMLPLAHGRLADAHRTGRGDPCDPRAELAAGRDELVAARERWLAGRRPEDAARAHPYGAAACQLFGWSLRDLRKDLAREDLAVPAGRLTTIPWESFDRPTRRSRMAPGRGRGRAA